MNTDGLEEREEWKRKEERRGEEKGTQGRKREEKGKGRKDRKKNNVPGVKTMGTGAIWGATGWCLMGQGQPRATRLISEPWYPTSQRCCGQAMRAEVTATLCPSHYSPVDVSGHRAGAKSAAEAGSGRLRLLARASGSAPQLPGCGPGCQSQGSQVRVVRSRWHGRALAFSPS